MSKTARLLDDYLDKSFVYSVLLNQSYSYYGQLKTLLKIPLILTSSVMSVVNGNIESSESLKIVNITFNLLTAIILGISSTFNIEQKYQNFLQAEKKFLKLSSKIEQKLLNEDDIIRTEFINEIMNEYDTIVDSIDYAVPQFICKRIRAQYATKKTLPIFINGIKKLETERSPRLSSFDNTGGSNKRKRKVSSIVFDDNVTRNFYNKFESSHNVNITSPESPMILTVKPLEVIVEDRK